MERNNMLNCFYVYHLIDPRNNLPFYVGKGKDKRMYDHEHLVRNGKIPQNNTYLFRKIKKILSAGLTINYKKIYENLFEQDALDKEVEEEGRLKKEGIKLCNLVPCGSGGNYFQYMSPSKIRRIKKKISNACKGRIVTNETRQKLRKLQLGRIRSKETRKKISIAKTGKKMSIKTCKKMSISHTGLHHSKEHCESISKSLKGIIFSDEHKNKLSDFAKTRTGEKNPNFRPLSNKNEIFIKSNLTKSVNWLVNHLPDLPVSRNRVKRYISSIELSEA